VFLEDYMLPFEVSHEEAADRLGISYPQMVEIVNGRLGVVPETALRLASYTSTEPEFWLNLQKAVDLWDALHPQVASEQVEAPSPAMY
jgi:antitoxin HigA-1